VLDGFVEAGHHLLEKRSFHFRASRNLREAYAIMRDFKVRVDTVGRA